MPGLIGPAGAGQIGDAGLREFLHAVAMGRLPFVNWFELFEQRQELAGLQKIRPELMQIDDQGISVVHLQLRLGDALRLDIEALAQFIEAPAQVQHGIAQIAQPRLLRHFLDRLKFLAHFGPLLNSREVPQQGDAVLDAGLARGHGLLGIAHLRQRLLEELNLAAAGQFLAVALGEFVSGQFLDLEVY